MAEKILHFIGSLEMGGTENMLLAYLQNTKSDEIEHVVCTIYNKGALIEKFEKSGIRVVSLNISSKLFYPIAFFRFSSMLNLIHPDVVHSYLLQENIIARIVCKIKGKKLICGKRDTDRYKNPLKVFLDKITLGLGNLNISNSKAGVEELQMYGVPENKVAYVPNGKDVYSLEKTLKKMDGKRKMGFSPEEVILCCVARLYKFKGQEYLIKAMPKIIAENQNAKLVLVGDGIMRKELEEICAKLKITERVLFLGERKDVLDILTAADLFVFPSLREGMPGALMEAMAAGLPVIATNIDGNKELVEDGKNGILVPVQDSEALANAVNKLLGDENMMRNLAKKARDTIKNDFSIDLMVKKLDKIYLDF